MAVPAPTVAQMPATDATDESTEIIITTMSGEQYVVPLSLVKLSGKLQKWYSELDAKEKKAGAKPTYVTQHITPFILNIVLEYCEDHQNDEAYDENAFDPLADSSLESLQECSNDDLLQLTYAACTLQIPQLTHVCGHLMGKRFEGKSAEEAKALFDPTALEEEEYMEEDMEDAAPETPADSTEPAAETKAEKTEAVTEEGKEDEIKSAA